MTQVEFIQRVKEIGGFEHIADASAALRAVLSALGSAFDPSERRLVSESLPTSLREVLEGESTRVSDPSLSGLLARVQHSQGISLGRAKEHAQVVCRALAEVLPFEVILWIDRHLPEIESLFELPEPVSAPAPYEHVLHPQPIGSRAHRTLAEGRPGSLHPLSEARPERAQAHSVARSDNPHEGTKLSSARGMTQEREQETLATSHSSSASTLSG
jgi:uncharacterized protein (DUF2267 family)